MVGLSPSSLYHSMPSDAALAKAGEKQKSLSCVNGTGAYGLRSLLQRHRVICFDSEFDAASVPTDHGFDGWVGNKDGGVADPR